MSEENKAIVRRFCAEVINTGHSDRAEEVVTADYVERQYLPGAEGCQGIEVAKAFLSLMRRAFPDYQFDVEDLVAAADEVVARLTVSGAHRGEMLGQARPASAYRRRALRRSASRAARWPSTGPRSMRSDCCGRSASGRAPADVAGAHARLPSEEATSHSALREVKTRSSARGCRPPCTG